MCDFFIHSSGTIDFRIWYKPLLVVLAEVVKRIFSLSLRKFDLSCQNYFTIKKNCFHKDWTISMNILFPNSKWGEYTKVRRSNKTILHETYQLVPWLHCLEYQKVKHESNSVHMSDSAKVIYFLLSAENWTISCRPTNTHWLGIQGNYCGN